jgi:hypothetical protein
MRALRRLGFALWLAFALVAGQQIAAWHLLGHATEKLSQTDPKPTPAKCDECFAGAQLSAGAASTVATLVVVTGSIAPQVSVEIEDGRTAVLAYRSRAPPALL